MPPDTPSPARRFRLAGSCVAALALGLVALWLAFGRGPADTALAGGDLTPPAKVPTPTPFSTWPAKKPDLAIVFSGQTYGYLSPCGCSRPQLGGLERRANLFKELRSKGWPVVGLDLGDVSPPHSKGVKAQNLLKYKSTMEALREMGYLAVGLGEYDFATQLWDLLSAYTLNANGSPPAILAANLLGVSRNDAGKVIETYPLSVAFPAVVGERPMVDASEISAPPGRPALGVVSAVGPPAADRAGKFDRTLDFARDAKGEVTSAPAIAAELKKMDENPANPRLRVLLYVGPLEDAKLAAAAFPQFQLILCQSDDPEPPTFPAVVNGGKTTIVQVGHKGRSVGVAGAFANPAGGFDIHYQLVELTEDYLTPPGEEAAKANKVLGILEDYTREVKRQDLLKQYAGKQILHSAQIRNPEANLKFVGSESCAKCHQAEFAKWESVPHSHAYDALVTKAKRPSNRQFDGECLVCHTVGMEYQTGFKNAEATPQLKNVGCENCHGPGSAHNADPKNRKFYDALSPWKQKPDDHLPDAATLERFAKMTPGELEVAKSKLPGNQREVMDAVDQTCLKCHDTENDPKFNLLTYWPKVNHSNLKQKTASK